MSDSRFAFVTALKKRRNFIFGKKNVLNNYFVVSQRVSDRQAADHEREDGQSGCRCRLRGRAVRRLVVAVVLE